MKVLIVGGYGFIGSNVAERYFKEGYEIYIIDKLVSPKVKKLDIKHKLYEISSSNSLCREICLEDSFDTVIYAAEIDEDGLLGLNNMLKFAKDSKVKQFIYISTTEVYESNLNDNYKIAEDYCKIFAKESEMKVNVLRVSSTYGPRQDAEEFDAVIKHRSSNHDYIYISDVVDAVFKTDKSGRSLLLNISSGIKYNNEDAKKELGWNVKYSFEDGLNQSKLWHEVHNKELNENDKVSKGTAIKIIKKIYPYLENILLCLAAYYLNMFLLKKSINTNIDLNYIYIILMAVMYGMRQAGFSIVLSIISKIFIDIYKGTAMVSIIYNTDTFINIALYVFIGITIAYMVDRKNEKIKELSDHNKDLKEKFEFVYSMYEDNRIAKKNLEEQILNKEDSLGKLYKIIGQLDSLSPSKIFDKSAIVMGQVMDNSAAAIYLLSRSGKYLRLISRTNSYSDHIQKSINLEDNYGLKKMISSGDIYVNNSLESNMPIMISPIVVNNKVVGCIALADMNFESLNLYKKNLFKITSLFVNNALAKAYKYDRVITEQKYIKDTKILNEEYFKEIVKQKYSEKYIASDNILLLLGKYKYSVLKRCIRTVDYIGLDSSGRTILLLTNIKENDASRVKDRLRKSGIEAKEVTRESVLS